MMNIKSKFDYYEDDTVQIIDLPYGDGLFNMTVFLPQFSQNLNDFIQSLDQDNLQDYLNALAADSVILDLPKFKIEYKIILNNILQKMGMPQAFNQNLADFSRINPIVKTFISKVLHKTFVQVDEEGTEAAAVTVVEMTVGSVEEPKINYMRVDHPFFFIIRERETNTLLFMGKITEPIWEE
jgi:serpin B